jgi:hypothetical protein
MLTHVSKRRKGNTMWGLPDSAILGTAKRIGRASKPRKRGGYGSFADDLATFAAEVEREAARRKAAKRKARR